MAKCVRPGFATVELPTGLELIDCPVLVGSNGPWARLPSKPVLGHEGKQVKPSGRRNSRLFSSGETASLAVVSGPQLPN
jgi:hypothetical protein